MLMCAIAHRGCTDIVRESALEADSEKEEKKKKKLAVLGTQACISIVPGFSVGHSTN